MRPRSALRYSLLLLAFAASAAIQAQPKTLAVCTEAAPEGFDPARYTSGYTFDASAHPLYNALAAFAPGSATVIPALAESWDVSADGLVYTFRLRQGVKFHSTDYFKPSREFNADDVLFSFQRMLDPQHPAHDLSPSGYPYADAMQLRDIIERIEKIDEHQVRFVLKHPEAPFLADLAMPFGSILSAEYAGQLIARGKGDELNSKPIGTGPFVFTRYRKDAQVRYAANPDYWKGKPAIDHLVLAITLDPNVRVQRLRRNECQIALTPKPEMADKALKTSVFVWEGTDKKGTKVKGELSSQNPTLVKAQLRKQGITPVKVRKKGISLLGAGKKIKPMDIALFTRQMSTMMAAGVPLLQSFDIISEGFDNPNMRKLVEEIKQEVASGNSLANSLRKKPQYFDSLYCNLVDAGEQSGALETLLDRVATYKEKTEALKAKIKKAMTYPIAVIVVAIIVSAILLIKVVPQFQSVFEGFGAELPAFTQMVINISNVLQEWWLLVLLMMGGAGFLLNHAYKRSEKFRDATDRTVLKLPIVGAILYKSAVARYARTLSTTFAAGVPLVEALDSVSGATGNVVFRDAVGKIKQDVSTGMQLNFSMRTTNIFPSMAIQMTAIGEESGALDDMLAKVAGFYEQEVDNAVDNLTALMEPMIMAVLGVLVGGLIIAMYLPIFQLGNVV